jgi:hypothetical protein
MTMQGPAARASRGDAHLSNREKNTQMSERFDVIGDVHGELPALERLGRELGYRSDWSHPEDRKLIFLGDLVDRGAHSLEVAELVHGLARAGRAACLMGNHEYNLVAHDLRVPGYEAPKTSNGPTIAEQARQPERWRTVLDYFVTLPIALEFPDLRLIHACWHHPSVERVKHLLRPEVPGGGLFSERIVLGSPFDARGLKAGLPVDRTDDGEDPPQEILLKGYEEASEPFLDADGHERRTIRSTWWNSPKAPVQQDLPLVVGHYWNLPPDARVLRPAGEAFCAPHPSGHPTLKKWQAAFAGIIEETGRVSWTSSVACIDFNGVTYASPDRACVGALRWPEREIVWAMGQKTSSKKGAA